MGLGKCCAVVNGHPVAVSILILAILGVVLSPYLLVGGLLLLLLFGIPGLPSPLRLLLPAPVVQVFPTTTLFNPSARLSSTVRQVAAS